MAHFPPDSSDNPADEPAAPSDAQSANERTTPVAAGSQEQGDSVLVGALRQHEFFAPMDAREVADFVVACSLVTALPGQPIWSHGDPKDAAFILASGRLEITYRVQPDGQHETQYSRPGSLLTLSSLVHPWPHGSACVALERSRVLRLSADIFTELFDAGRPIAFHLIDAIADDLVNEMRDANRRLHEVFGHPAETLRMLRRRSRGNAQ